MNAARASRLLRVLLAAAVLASMLAVPDGPAGAHHNLEHSRTQARRTTTVDATAGPGPKLGNAADPTLATTTETMATCRRLATAFTTGGTSADRFPFAGLEIAHGTTNVAARATLEVALHNAPATGSDPGTKIADLTQEFVGASSAVYNAPTGTDIVLHGATTYFVVAPETNTANHIWTAITDNDEHATSAGWSIADQGRRSSGCPSSSNAYAAWGGSTERTLQFNIHTVHGPGGLRVKEEPGKLTYTWTSTPTTAKMQYQFKRNGETWASATVTDLPDVDHDSDPSTDPVPVTSWSKTGLTNGLQYDFRVRSDSATNTDWAELIAARPTGRSSAVTGLYTSHHARRGEIELRWDPPRMWDGAGAHSEDRGGQAVTSYVEVRWKLKAGALAYNTDQTVATYGQNYTAQSFRTGSDPLGYTLSSIGILHSDNVFNDTAEVSVKIRSDDSGSPAAGAGGLVATLSGSKGRGPRLFTAPTNTTLAADTTYWVSIGEGLLSAKVSSFAVTSSNAQGGLPGWTIGDGTKWRAAEADAWSDAANSVMLDINGGANSYSNPAQLRFPGYGSQFGNPFTGPSTVVTGPGFLASEMVIGSEYTFQVRTDRGNGDWASVDATLDYESNPDPVFAVYGDKRAVVYWNTDPRRFTDSYEYQYKKTSDANWSALAKVPTGEGCLSPERVVLTGLTNNTEYQVRVRSDLGDGAWTTQTFWPYVEQQASLAKVTGVTAALNADGTVKVDWTASTQTGNWIYAVRYAKTDDAYPLDDRAFSRWYFMTSGAGYGTKPTEVNVPMKYYDPTCRGLDDSPVLERGSTYKFQVALATDNYQVGPPSDAMVTVATPTDLVAVTNVVATPLENGVYLTWDDQHEADKYQWRTWSPNTGQDCASQFPDGTEWDEFPGSAPTAYSDRRETVFSHLEAYTDPFGVKRVRARYRIKYYWTRFDELVPTVGGAVRLTNGLPYCFQIRAFAGSGSDPGLAVLKGTGIGGTGPLAEPVYRITPRGNPWGITGLTATAGDGQATLCWDQPADLDLNTPGIQTVADDSRYPIRGWQYQVNNDGVWHFMTNVTGPPAGPTATRVCSVIRGLVNGNSHLFLVRTTGKGGGNVPDFNFPWITSSREGGVFWYPGGDAAVQVTPNGPSGP